MFELSPLTALSLALWSVSSDLCALSSGVEEEFTVGAVGGLVSEERVALQKEKRPNQKIDPQTLSTSCSTKTKWLLFDNIHQNYTNFVISCVVFSNFYFLQLNH